MSFALAVEHIEIHSEILGEKAIVNFTITPSFPGENVSVIFEKKFDVLYLDKNCLLEGRMIKCNLSENEKFSISLPVEESDIYSFENNFRVTRNVVSLSYLLKLPEGAILPKSETKFYPLNASVITDGRHLYILWKRKNLGAGEIFGIEAFYEVKKEGDNKIVFWSILISSIVLVSGIIFYIFGIRRRKDVKSIILPVLKDDEKRVMEIILNYPKGINQKKIVEESGYSKAKVSKVLKSLEERGLVKLERLGRTNKVFVSKDFWKKEKENEENNESGRIEGNVQ